MKHNIITIMAAAALASCGGASQQNDKSAMETDSLTTTNLEAGKPCSVEFCGVRFDRAVNGADSLVSISEGRLRFEAGERMDFFCDPDEKISNNTAPILLKEIDNTKPFTLTAKVSPSFTETGTFNAAVLYIYANDRFWQKLCFEQDERSNHRIVSVRTQGTSDDNNHDIVPQDWVYLRIFSDTRTVAFYYSTDKKEWIMVRLYKNNYPDRLFLGISNQCPKDKHSHSVFEDLTLSTDSVANIRMGS